MLDDEPWQAGKNDLRSMMIPKCTFAVAEQFQFSADMENISYMSVLWDRQPDLPSWLILSRLIFSGLQKSGLGATCPPLPPIMWTIAFSCEQGKNKSAPLLSEHLKNEIHVRKRDRKLPAFP